MEKFNVYQISPNPGYHGFALVAAESVQEANDFIESYKDEDRNNTFDSWGYSFISDYDLIEGIFQKKKVF